MAQRPRASALLLTATERGQRLGRHHAAFWIRAVHERIVVSRETALRLTERSRDARQLQRPISSILRRPRGVPPRALTYRVRAQERTASRPLLELRQLLVFRRRGRRV